MFTSKQARQFLLECYINVCRSIPEEALSGCEAKDYRQKIQKILYKITTRTMQNDSIEKIFQNLLKVPENSVILQSQREQRKA